MSDATTTAAANATQVGGNHYRQHGADLQHWDLAVLYKWDPFQYQITKYVMRWKYKHSTHAERLKDLQKAAHFLQKYIEVAERYTVEDPPAVVAPPVTPDATATTYSPAANDDWSCEGFYGDCTQLYKCRHCGDSVRAVDLVEAYLQHGDCARAGGYVNQG